MKAAKLRIAVYQVRVTLDDSVLVQSQNVLQNLADISWDVHNTVGLSSRLSSHMILCYHHVSLDALGQFTMASQLMAMKIVGRVGYETHRHVCPCSIHREPNRILQIP